MQRFKYLEFTHTRVGIHAMIHLVSMGKSTQKVAQGLHRGNKIGCPAWIRTTIS